MDAASTQTAEDGGGRFLTRRRIAALAVLVVLAVGLMRRVGFVREVIRQRRRLQLAFSILVLLRNLRKR